VASLKPWLALAAVVFALPTAPEAQSTARLHADIVEVIQQQYFAPGMETRYLDGSTDLNADGQREAIVHVVGGTACGTGGCPTLVFTHAASGFRLISTITVSNPPIRASSSVTNGWRNLIVHVAGGGATSREVELLFDGKSYPGNPTVAGGRVKPTTNPRGEMLIQPFTSFEQAKPLPRPGAVPFPRQGVER
jgi:hypothetical protein